MGVRDMERRLSKLETRSETYDWSSWSTAKLERATGLIIRKISGTEPLSSREQEELEAYSKLLPPPPPEILQLSDAELERQIKDLMQEVGISN